MMKEYCRPVVVVSKCLGFDHCRYNGQIIADDFVEKLTEYVDYVTTCPEMEIGLGVPREPVRIVERETVPRLVQSKTELDLTEQMQAFSASFFDTLDHVDGFLLKNRSPSCGLTDVKIYGPRGNVLGKGSGLFGQAARERFPKAALEDEGRLKNYRLREHFLTRLYTLTAFRERKKTGRMKELVAFHTENKLLFMAYNQDLLRRLGRIVANPEKQPASKVMGAYEHVLDLMFAAPPSYKPNINVMMHILGYFSKRLDHQEKHYLLDLLEKYRKGKVPLSVPLHVLYSWVVRFEEPYLVRQTYFMPYPESLVEITDSGKGRAG